MGVLELSGIFEQYKYNAVCVCERSYVSASMRLVKFLTFITARDWQCGEPIFSEELN